LWMRDASEERMRKKTRRGSKYEGNGTDYTNHLN